MRPLPLIALALLCACAPKLRIESPEEPIRIEMTVTVRHEVDAELEHLFREQDALAGGLAPAPSPDGQASFELRILSDTAQALTEAKFAGVLGERRDGYLGLVAADAAEEPRRLMSAVNGERRQHYAEIAASHDVSPEAVARAGGELLIRRATPGQHVEARGGGWMRR